MLSILLPTYNGARFLEEQVASIIAQTFTDWELLILDDGSTDDTVAVTRALAATDARIRPLPAEGNRGQKRRLAELFAASRGELVAVSDQDDIWVSDKLALLIGALGDADMSFGPSRLIDADGRELGRTLLDGIPPAFHVEDRLTMLHRPAVSAHAMVARRRVLAGPAFVRVAPFDWSISLEAAFGAGLVYVPEAATLHRMHGTNQMNGQFGQARPAARLVSRYELRKVFRWVQAFRQIFLGNIEHLMFAETLVPDVSRRFTRVYELCADSWSGTTRPTYLTPRQLLAELEVLLRPLAGSERDWAAFEDRMRRLCLPAAHPRRLLDRARRSPDMR